VGPGPGANRYCGGRLPNHKGEPEEAAAPASGALLGEVRGDRAGRGRAGTIRLTQNFTSRPRRAIELWIGTLNRVPFWSVRRSIR
jgi:hypothetical protein